MGRVGYAMGSIETERHQQQHDAPESPSPTPTSASILQAGPYVIRNGAAPASQSRNGMSPSPPESTTAQFHPSTSTAGADQKPKRKRSMVACKNCNERRVRCDGATNGLPCSNCKHAGKPDCRFIQSKRVRGARGRFESREGESGSLTSLSGSSSRPLLPRRRARRHSISGATDGDEWRQLLQNSASANRSATAPVTYLGESWHLSWIVGQQLTNDEKPLHLPTLVMEEDGGVHNRANRELWEKGAYLLPRYEVREMLIAQYFEVVHPTYPVLCKRGFLQSLQTDTFSHQLVQAVLLVAATHCDWAILQRAGYVSRREAVEGFYHRARALFDGDVEPDKVTNIQTMFLMQFWWRAVTDHKDTLWWLAGAIRMAQTMGLHRSTKRSRLSDADRRLWRRLWWMLYVRDRQVASHMGKPLLIHEEDCDVENISPADLEGECDRQQALHILELVKLTKLVSATVSCEFAPGCARDLPSRIRLREACHQRLSEWQKSLPPELIYQSNNKDLYAMTLQMGFLAQLLLLNRPIIYTDLSLPEYLRIPSEKIAANAADAITKICDDVIRHFGARYMSQHSMSCLFSAMTVHLINRRSANPEKSGDADRKLRLNMANLVPLDKILPMAGWINRRYQRMLDREGEEEGEGEEAARSMGIPPSLVTSPSLPLPPPPPFMEDVKVMNTIAETPIEDHWGGDMAPLLHIEQSMTAMEDVIATDCGMGVIEGVLGGRVGSENGCGEIREVGWMQPEVYDYQWFMENIGDFGGNFWWTQPEKWE